MDRAIVIPPSLGIASALVAGAIFAAPLGSDPAPVYPRPTVEVTFGNDMSDEQGPLFRSLGVTSVESYVTWQTVEDAGQGQWNWQKWDRQVGLLKKHGLRWVPFVIAGCAYATPKWFREGPDHLGAVCLEHGIASGVESIWNPAMPAQVGRFLEAFAAHYRAEDIVESVLLGISGDYGEAVFPVWGGGWTFKIPGKYHTHPGYWCGDARAREAFRRDMLAAYGGSLAALNEAWGTSFAAREDVAMPRLEDIEPPETDRPTRAGKFFARSAQDRRRWLDFVRWYRGSMTAWADRWLALARKYFPETEIYLCTGGDARPPHGSDFSAQCLAASRYRAGVRITNEGSDYAKNFYLTRGVAAAARRYGAYCGFEPAGKVDAFGNVARIFNAATAGAGQLHCYQDNVTATEERKSLFLAHANHLKPDAPRVALAAWYPKTALALCQTQDEKDSEWQTFRAQVSALRDIADVDVVDDAPSGYPVLAVIGGSFIEKEDLDRVRAWVEAGGTLIACDFGGALTVEGDRAPWDDLVGGRDGGERATGKGRAVRVAEKSVGGEGFVRAVTEALLRAGAPVPDGAVDGVFAACFAKRVLYLNTTDRAVEKTVRIPGREPVRASIPPKTIHEVALP